MNKFLRVTVWSCFVFALTGVIAVLASPTGVAIVFSEHSFTLWVSLAACLLVGVLLVSSES